MNMIRVVVTGQAREGRFPYLIETPGTRLSSPTSGLSATPLLDACRRIKDLGAAPDHAVIALFQPGAATWQMRTTIGYGASKTTPEKDKAGFRAYKTMPPEQLAAAMAKDKEAIQRAGGPTRAGVAPTGAKPARSQAAPPPPHTPPASPAGKGPAHAAPAKPKTTPRKPKPAGSGGRRGRR